MLGTLASVQTSFGAQSSKRASASDEAVLQWAAKMFGQDPKRSAAITAQLLRIQNKSR